MAKFIRRSTQRKGRRAIRRPAYRRKTTRGRMFKRRSNKVSRFRAPLGNFPNTKTVALRYVENVTLDGSASGTVVNVFRVNSIYDPNYTGAGHQPMFRDNYAAIYEQYRVNYATITMVALDTHVVNVATANQVSGTNVGDNFFYNQNQRACRMFIMRDRDPSDYNTELDTLVEEGNSNFVWKYCPQTTSGKMPTLRLGCWPHSLLNLSKKDDTLKSAQDNNPMASAYFICGVTDLGSGNPDSMAFQFIITYNVTMSNLVKNQTQN